MASSNRSGIDIHDEVRAAFNDDGTFAAGVEGLGHAYMDRCRTVAVRNDRVVKVYLSDPELACAREVSALEGLAGGPLPVPELLATGRLAGGLPWVLMTRLPGSALDDVRGCVDHENGEELAATMGQMLALLHGHTQVPGETIDVLQYRLDRSLLVPSASEGGAPPALLAAIEEELERCEDSLEAASSEAASLVHRDYSARNVLVHREGPRYVVSGIIDYEKSRRGDPMEDFGPLALHHFWAKNWKCRFLEGYGRDLTAAQRDRFRYHALLLTLRGMAWASTGDASYFAKLETFASALLCDDRAFDLSPCPS